MVQWHISLIKYGVQKFHPKALLTYVLLNMEYLADKCLENGDLKSATDLFTSLEKTNQKYSKMARICRVLNNPANVPLPHRHSDICEALLDPSITSSILLRGTPSVESIRKYYQQLIVHVHPDKNPKSSAKEAFLRLGVLQEDALHYIEKKQKEAAVQIPKKPPDPARSRKKMKGTKDAAVASRLENDMTNLLYAKKNRITLKSLKRKDIADDFQIFSSPRNCYNPQAGDIDEDQTQSIDRNAQLRTKTNPSVRSRRKSKHQKQSSHAKDITFTTPGCFSPMSASKSQQEAGFDVEKEECSDHGEEGDLSTAEIESVDNSQVYPFDSCSEMNSEEDSILRETFPHDDCNYNQIRDKISAIIEELNNMRLHKAPVRLECDLSFAAYERIKNEARLGE